MSNRETSDRRGVFADAWLWQHGRHRWVAGRPIVARTGYQLQADCWVQHDARKWMMQGGWGRGPEGEPVPPVRT